MKTKKISYAILMLLPLAVTGIAMFFLPDEIPAHYGANGMVDRWGSKFESFIFPVTIIGFGLFMLLAAKLAGKVEEEKNNNNEKITITVGLVIMAVFNMMNFAILYLALSGASSLSELPIDFRNLVVVLLGIAFIIIGNIMPKARMNSLLGFRTPWTMKNEVTWKKCQLFGGITFIIDGFVTAIGGLFVFKGTAAIIFMLVMLAVTLIVDVIYSYFIMKKHG